MGREIRMVPKGWEHPKNERGHYQPLFDKSFNRAASEWWATAVAWQNRDAASVRAAGGYLPGDDVEAADIFDRYPWFWQWDGSQPHKDYYRPEWAEPADHFQMYETVSEGTPVSPVFATKGELAEWLSTEGGYSADAAQNFVDGGWAPSMVICDGKVHNGMEGLVACRSEPSDED